MDQRTLTALQASIRHWEENAAITDIEDANLTIGACALCAEFWHAACKGCPVYQFTERTGCENTPYYYAYDACSNGDLSAFLKAAEAELEFLRSLLPTQESST